MNINSKHPGVSHNSSYLHCIRCGTLQQICEQPQGIEGAETPQHGLPIFIYGDSYRLPGVGAQLHDWVCVPSDGLEGQVTQRQLPGRQCRCHCVIINVW